MPFVGKGCWVLPLFVLKNKTLEHEIMTLRKHMHREIEQSQLNRDNEYNPQVALKEFKNKVITICWKTAREAIPKIRNKIKTLKMNLCSTLDDPYLENEEKQLVGLEIQQKIDNLEILRHA